MQPLNSGIQRRSGTLLEMRYVICVCAATHSILRIIILVCVGGAYFSVRGRSPCGLRLALHRHHVLWLIAAEILLT